MRLGARILRAVSDVNNFEYANEFIHNELSANTVYIQLVNLEHNIKGDPAGISYQPAAGSTLKITLPSLDINKLVEKTATQPFLENVSIWSAPILATDEFGSGNIFIELTEGGVVKRMTITNGSNVEPIDPSLC